MVGASIVVNAYKEGVIGLGLLQLETALAKGEEDREHLLSQLLGFVSKDPEKASAELNTCLGLMRDGYQRGKQQWAYLLSSDTEVGRLCGLVLRDYLEAFSRGELGGRMGIHEPIEVRHLGEQDKFGDGLGNLFKTIVDLIKQHKRRGDVTFIHATGGFKPETAIAMLAANSPEAGAPVFYVHEHFRKVIRIPAMPVRLRKWKEFSGLMSTLLGMGASGRRALEGKFGRGAVDEAIRLGWADEERGYLRPTEMGKFLWRRV